MSSAIHSRMRDSIVIGDAIEQGGGPALGRVIHLERGAVGAPGLPWELSRVPLSAEQQLLYRMFGYGRNKLVRPGPILPSGL